MPIYEYRCDACGATRELILKPGEEARPSCAACRKRMRRVISPTAFILKGAGWFVNDYPSQDRKRGMEAERGKTSSSGESGTGDAAAKPAEKAAVTPADKAAGKGTGKTVGKPAKRPGPRAKD